MKKKALLLLGAAGAVCTAYKVYKHKSNKKWVSSPPRDHI